MRPNFRLAWIIPFQMALAPDAATALISHPVSQLSMRQRDRHCQCTQDHGYSCVCVLCTRLSIPGSTEKFRRYGCQDLRISTGPFAGLILITFHLIPSILSSIRKVQDISAGSSLLYSLFYLLYSILSVQIDHVDRASNHTTRLDGLHSFHS